VQDVKALNDFKKNNEQWKSFTRGLDKKDEKVLGDESQKIEIEASEVLYKKESMERAIIFVTKGTLVEFTASGDNIEYRSGAILGVEQFLFNKKWENTIICETAAVVLKFKWETLRDLQQRNATLAVNAARIY
jgi:signal-transduction protein with cAMP-binding, CBS, and nucleotidyltransferase domain